MWLLPINLILLVLLINDVPSVISSSDCLDVEGSVYCQKSKDICHNGTNGQDQLSTLCQCLYPLKHNESNSSNNDSKKPSSLAVWGYGILCVTIISMMSVLGVGFLPLMSSWFYDHLLTCLIGLAVGSLSGSAIFHLIPSAFKLSDVHFYPHHGYLTISMVIWAGIYGFFVIERFLKIFMEYKSRKQGISFSTTHNHHNNVLEDTPEVLGLTTDESRHNMIQEESEEEIGMAAGGCAGVTIPKGEVYEHSKAAMRASFGHMERPDHPDSRPTVTTIKNLEEKAHGSKIATVAWMIIFGDGVHNFIDGLSIGAAFSESILTGISVSVAVLCEEFPHELGDFAVLLNAGMSVRQAMVYNFLSACTCYLGLILGILLGELHMGNQYIFASAGGMFLYIALVDMVPELNSTMDQLSKTSARQALAVFGLQNVGILAGIISLFVLARFQDDIQIDL